MKLRIHSIIVLLERNTDVEKRNETTNLFVAIHQDWASGPLPIGRVPTAHCPVSLCRRLAVVADAVARKSAAVGDLLVC